MMTIGRVLYAFLSIFSSYAFGANFKCPNTDTFQASVTLKDDSILIVCGNKNNDKPVGDKKAISEYRVYITDAHKTKPIPPYNITVKEAELLNWAGDGDYLIYPEGDKLVFDEVIFYGKKWVPALRRTLACKKRKCIFSQEQCIFKKGTEGSIQEFTELQSYINGPNKGRPVSDILISNVGQLALSGNSKAIDMFYQGNKYQLDLDGAAAELHGDLSLLLERLKKSGCN